MIGCLVIAFALCQTGYYQPAPTYYAPAPQVYYAPAPQVAYAQPVYGPPYYPAYGAPVALNLRFGGWGSGYGHWHR